MLYLLYQFASINIFQYITVRAGLAFFFGFVLTIYLMPKFIRWARAKKASQPIYELAPEAHRAKAGTPTMGGVVFIFSTIVATLLTAKLSNFYVIGGLLSLALFSLIGIQDDYSKISKAKNSAGLSARGKLVLQFLCAFIVAFILYYFSHSTELYTPFYKLPLFEMGVFGIVLWMFVIVASSNAVNLTDGLDDSSYHYASIRSFATIDSFFDFFQNIL